MTLAPAFLTLALLNDDERLLVRRMSDALSVYAPSNQDAIKYYEGSYVTTQFGISIPPSMQTLQTVAGWPGTVVDVLEERLDWLGWTTDGDDYGLSDTYSANMLDVDSGMTHLDSLMMGASFVAVGSGDADEPSPLVTSHSPCTMTTLWDARKRRNMAGLSISSIRVGLPTEASLYLPNQTITMERENGYGEWIVVERDQHNMNRVPIVKFPNRVRGSRTEGRSEITKAVRYYTDAASRTLLGLEVNREFYNSPKIALLNATEEMFTDAAGNAVNQWTAIQGRVWGVPAPEDPTTPGASIQHIPAASPAPYIDQIRGYAQLLSAEAGIPGAYLGFHTDNPASADAIRAGEARLVKRAERRQTTFGRAWLETGYLVLLVRDGAVPDDYARRVSNRWRDAATPTRAAAADEALKLTSGDNPILPPDSTVTYDRIGLSPAEQAQIIADKRRTAGRGVLAALTAAAPVTPSVVGPPVS